MLQNSKLLILFAILSASLSACSYKMSQKQNFAPYLEDVRALQIPQWEHENWYVEDWTSQKPADQIIRDLYKADVFKDQIEDKKGKKTLVVGPNFYRLSGFDKRRVVTLLDRSYQNTGTLGQNSFFLTDWRTKQYIGTFDREEGLRLH